MISGIAQLPEWRLYCIGYIQLQRAQLFNR